MTESFFFADKKANLPDDEFLNGSYKVSYAKITQFGINFFSGLNFHPSCCSVAFIRFSIMTDIQVNFLSKNLSFKWVFYTVMDGEVSSGSPAAKAIKLWVKTKSPMFNEKYFINIFILGYTKERRKERRKKERKKFLTLSLHEEMFLGCNFIIDFWSNSIVNYSFVNLVFSTLIFLMWLISRPLTFKW